MNHLRQNLDDLNSYLTSVLTNVKEIGEDNFNYKMSEIKTLVNKIEDKRVYLINNFDIDVLKTHCDAANMAVKQIFTEFDSMIERKKRQQAEISIELSKLVNKKKLIKYQR